MTSDWFPRQAGTLHTLAAVSLCVLQQRDLHRGWNLVPTSDLWGSAFASSPVTTNNPWIAVNVSAAASPPSPLWTIGLHSTCTNRTLSWALHYQLCCIWYLRFPPHDALRKLEGCHQTKSNKGSAWSTSSSPADFRCGWTQKYGFTRVICISSFKISDAELKKKKKNECRASRWERPI